jgi:peptidoglycan/LPS O-acetylase OafA/YrhL
MSIKYRPEIDGLRAVAIIIVILFHYVNLRGGFVGVDVFFVISGYLITTIITEKVDKNIFSFIDFYKRRIKRIFPALITVLISSLIIGWVSLLASEFESLGLHITAGALFVSNFLLLKEIGYFDVASELKPLLHLWSLSIEEQFYIIWPGIIFIVYKFKLPLRFTLLIILIASFSFNIYESRISNSSDFYLPTTRFWELALGGLLYGDFLKSYTTKNKIIDNLIPFVGLLMIVLCLLFVTKNTTWPSYYALLPTLGAVFIILSSKNSLINRFILGSRPMVLIGLISYPLYLWHWPILSFLRIVSEEGGLKSWVKIFAIFLSFCLAISTYFLVEKPIRFSPKKNTFNALIVSMALLGLTGYLTVHNKGFDFRYPEAEFNAKQFQLISNSNLQILTKVDCSEFTIHDTNPGCFVSNKNKKPTIVVIGDSHAVHNTIGLTDYFNKSGENLSIIYQAGCLPFFDVQVFRSEVETCSINMRESLNFAIKSPEIKTIILSSRGSWYLHGREFNSNLGVFRIGLVGTNSAIDREYIFSQGLRSTLTKIKESGKQAIFIIDNPELGFNPRHCSLSRPLSIANNYNSTCSQPFHDSDDYDRPYREILKNVQREYPFLKVLDSTKYLCDGINCYGKINGKILYSDKNHLSTSGSQYLGEKFSYDLDKLKYPAPLPL